MVVTSAGLAGLGALMAALAWGVGLTPLGWVVGVLCGLVPTVAVARSRRGPGPGRPAAGARPTPRADLVTLTRALLASGVAALVADSFVRPSAPAVLVALTAVALGLDAVDGWVARRTGTASTFGARFDGETDAFLILVLSVHAASRYGVWVLALGAVRYAFWLAGRACPWLRAALPPRYWRKVVTAVVGVVLATAASDLVPHGVVASALVVAAVLLAESFGRDVVWLWRHRLDAPAEPLDPVPSPPARTQGPRRRVIGPAVDLLALLLVWVVLLAPTELPAVTPAVLLRVPVEALAMGVIALALPARPRRTVAVVVGLLLALVMVVKLLDLGFFAALGRPFNPLTDLGLFGPVFALTRDTIGRVAGDVVGVTAVLVVVALLVGVPLSLRRVTSLTVRNRRRSATVLTSPTFGGHSWLAHSTLQSGLWVSDEGRYGRLLGSDRMTLSRFFHRAGWRTVAVQPSDGEPWPQGRSFYRFDRIYDGPQLGYHGPRFGFSTMPDQFALEALHRRVLAPTRRPVFAQIELASSHTPWAPLPRLVDWDRLGDGTVFGPIRDRAQGVRQLWDHRELVPRAYARSIRYTLTALIQFVRRYGTTTWCSSCWATTSRRASCPATTRAIRCRSPSSPPTRPCSTGSTGGVGSVGCCPAGTPPSGGWTPSATGCCGPTTARGRRDRLRARSV